MNSPAYAAVDIGGTKVSVALFDQKLQLLSSDTFPTAGFHCGSLATECHKRALQQCEALGASYDCIHAVGVASPGPLDLKTGTILHIPTLQWRDEPLKQYFEDRFKRRVTVENDTNAAALGEYRFGAGQGYSSVVYITVSTGIGCGIVLGGRIYDGAVDAAGELGHMKVIRGGRPCGCGGRGCLEAHASGRSIGEIASERRGKFTDARETFRLAREGDLEMLEIIDQAAEAIGYAISVLYQILDPGVVIMGGSVTRDFDFFGPRIIRAAEEYIQPHPLRQIRIVKSGFDGQQVLMGAACLAAETEGRRVHDFPRARFSRSPAAAAGPGAL